MTTTLTLFRPFHGQVLGTCLVESCLNDCFLHFIAVAPKMNAKLLEIIDAIMVPFQGAQQRGDIDAMPTEISDGLHKVGSVLRGVAALLSPEASWNIEPRSRVV